MILEIIHSILTSEDEKPSFAQVDLSYYGVQFWIQHLLEIEPDDLTQDELVRTIDSICGILSNRGGSIRKMEEHLQYDLGVAPCSILGNTEESLGKALTCIQKWAVKATQLPSSSISGGTVAWMRPFARNPKAIHIKIADAHVSNWLASYDADWDYLIYRRFAFAHEALYLGRELPAVQQNESLRKYWETRDAEPNTHIFSKESFMAVSRAFLHIDMTAQSYKSIGVTMVLADLKDEGLEQLRLGAQSADTPLDSLTIFAKMGNAILDIVDRMEPPKSLDSSGHNSAGPNGTTEEKTAKPNPKVGAQEGADRAKMEDAKPDTGSDNEAKTKTYEDWVHEALDVLSSALGVVDKIPPSDLENLRVQRTIREIWLMKAQAELYLNNATNTVSYCHKAKAVIETDERVTGPIATIVTRLAKMEEWEKLMDVLRPLCLNKYDVWYYIYQYGNEIDRAAKEAGRVDNLIDLYRECAMLEDLRTWPLTTMHGWAAFYQEVIGTKDAIQKAKAILNKIIDVSTVTSNITTASFRLANILLQEFRTTREPAEKLAAYREMQALVKRVGDMMGSDFDSNQSQNMMPLVLMMRRLDAYEYHQSLDRMFKGCIQALTDEVSWNDKGSFRALAKTLAVVGLEEDARIAVTCQIYITDMEVHKKDRSMSESEPDSGDTGGHSEKSNGALAETGSNGSGSSEKHREEEKKNSDDNDFAASEVDEDLDSANGQLGCDGCGELFSNWHNGSLYLCYYCTELDLCEKCYTNRSERLSGKLPPDWRVICPAGHKHIKAPAEGWKGLKNGVLKFEDKEMVFRDWLVELKEKKWPEAWERYWDGEST